MKARGSYRHVVCGGNIAQPSATCHIVPHKQVPADRRHLHAFTRLPTTLALALGTRTHALTLCKTTRNTCAAHSVVKTVDAKPRKARGGLSGPSGVYLLHFIWKPKSPEAALEGGGGSYNKQPHERTRATNAALLPTFHTQ